MAKRLNQLCQRSGVCALVHKTVAPQTWHEHYVVAQSRLSLLLVTHLNVILLRKRFSWDWLRVDFVFHAFTLLGPSLLGSDCDDDTCRFFLGQRDYRSRNESLLSSQLLLSYAAVVQAGPTKLADIHEFARIPTIFKWKRIRFNSLPARLNFRENAASLKYFNSFE